MKILIFQTCLLLLNSKTSSAECLPKYGFGLSQSNAPVPVDGQYSLKSDMSECQTHCDDRVTLIAYI